MKRCPWCERPAVRLCTCTPREWRARLKAAQAEVPAAYKSLARTCKDEIRRLRAGYHSLNGFENVEQVLKHIPEQSYVD